MTSNKTIRNVCFTVNNPTEEQFNRIQTLVDGTIEISPGELIPTNVRFVIFQKEVGEKTGTVHLQGYCEFKKSVRWNWVQQWIFPHNKFLMRNGTQAEAIVYCAKQHTRIEGPWIFGKPGKSNQGKRSDLIDLKNEIQPFQKVTDLNEEYLSSYSKNIRLCKEIKAEKEYKATLEFRKVECHVIWGKAGTGKSRNVLYYEDNSRNPNVYKIDCDGSSDIWFDGYAGESIILFDDFYGEINYGFFLKITDGHQIRLKVKGGFTYANWTTVYFTSNDHPASWYIRGMTDAFTRRFKTITEVSDKIKPCCVKRQVDFNELKQTSETTPVTNKTDSVSEVGVIVYPTSEGNKNQISLYSPSNPNQIKTNPIVIVNESINVEPEPTYIYGLNVKENRNGYKSPILKLN